MASEDLSSNKFGKIISWLVNPIFKAKSKSSTFSGKTPKTSNNSLKVFGVYSLLFIYDYNKLI